MSIRELKQDPDIVAENSLLDARQNGDSMAVSVENGNSRSDGTAGALLSVTVRPFRFISLKLNGNTFTGCVQTAELLMEVGGVDAILRMTKIFYNHVFMDSLLDTFIASHQDPHFKRLGLWIVEKMDPTQDVWTQERQVRNANPCPVTLAGGHTHVVHDRSSAHAAAWYSKKRPEQLVGLHFKLNDARVWMRLMFWSARETGLLAHPTFADWFVRFIAHFMRVYERTAPQFARESLRWSESQANIDLYLASKKRRTLLGEDDCTQDYFSMPGDVVTLTPLSQALQALPLEEYAESSNWPYHQQQL